MTSVSTCMLCSASAIAHAYGGCAPRADTTLCAPGMLTSSVSPIASPVPWSMTKLSTAAALTPGTPAHTRAGIRISCMGSSTPHGRLQLRRTRPTLRGKCLSSREHRGCPASDAGSPAFAKGSARQGGLAVSPDTVLGKLKLQRCASMSTGVSEPHCWCPGCPARPQ